MEIYHSSEEREEDESYVLIRRADDMDVGIYRLAAGAEDGQSPHKEDEIYYVISGRGRIRGGTREVEIAPGDILFVPAHEPHQFYDIREDLELLVVFAPPEGSTW